MTKENPLDTTCLSSPIRIIQVCLMAMAEEEQMSNGNMEEFLSPWLRTGPEPFPCSLLEKVSHRSTEV